MNGKSCEGVDILMAAEKYCQSLDFPKVDVSAARQQVPMILVLFERLSVGGLVDLDSFINWSEIVVDDLCAIDHQKAVIYTNPFISRLQAMMEEDCLDHDREYGDDDAADMSHGDDFVASVSNTLTSKSAKELKKERRLERVQHRAQ